MCFPSGWKNLHKCGLTIMFRSFCILFHRSQGVKRVGPMHQAGSDALLTSATYVSLRFSFSFSLYMCCHAVSLDSLLLILHAFAKTKPNRYMQLVQDYFKGNVDKAEFVGVLYGLGKEFAYPL